MERPESFCKDQVDDRRFLRPQKSPSFRVDNLEIDKQAEVMPLKPDGERVHKLTVAVGGAIPERMMEVEISQKQGWSVVYR